MEFLQSIHLLELFFLSNKSFINLAKKLLQFKKVNFIKILYDKLHQKNYF